LDAEALAALRLIRLRPLQAQFEPLRELIQRFPDYTPAAIIAAIALRQHGDFSARSLTAEIGPSPIPRVILQFWDSNPPDHVRGLMTSWQELNPAYTWTCFDDEKAKVFLEEEFGGEVLTAYERAPIPAQKADIFRLAYLVARGGVYADADDRCLAPIDSFLRRDATLVVHQENYGSIGNNFIAATPEHPVLMRALELATAAMLRGDHDLVWLSTGPGLLTRAFALEWAVGRIGGLLRRTQIMDLGELQRVVGIHCPVRYKSTHRHWSRAAFGRLKRRP
jgi:mannosyltransferase OCH1-like enzyme